MKFNLLIRKTHYWATAVIAIPTLIIVVTGLLLQIKKEWTWVQPAERRGTGTSPSIEFSQILAAVRREPDLGVKDWDDVQRIDVRPGRGVAKVWLKNGFEVQIDLGTGAVLQSAYRRSDWIESIHDGSFFAGDTSKLGVFLPSGIVLLAMWFTGVWMFFVPFWMKRKRRAHE